MRERFRYSYSYSYSVEEVREAANGTSFDEIGHNEIARMISFRNQRAARINVYFTTERWAPA